MSVHLSDLVWRRSAHKGSELLVLLSLADNGDWATGQAYPSIVHIATKTRLSKGGVHAILVKLLAGDELTIVKKGKRGSATLYRIEISALLEKGDRLEALRVQRSNESHERKVQDDDGKGSLASEAQPSVEPSEGRKTSSSSPAKTRKKDLVWDALTATLFIPHTKHEEKRIGQAARELRAAVEMEFGDMNGALDSKCAEEIVRRMAAYPREWSARTPEALVKHWTDLGAGGDGADRARVADRLRRMSEHDGGKGAP